MPINDDPRTQAKRQNDADDRKVDNPLANFDEDHLQLLTGIAGIAAPALDTICRVETLETEKLAHVALNTLNFLS